MVKRFDSNLDRLRMSSIRESRSSEEVIPMVRNLWAVFMCERKGLEGGRDFWKSSWMLSMECWTNLQEFIMEFRGVLNSWLALANIIF